MSEDVYELNLDGGGRNVRRALGVGGALVLLVGAIVVYFSLTVRVGADEFAVRQVFLGPSQGVQEGTYGPGLHFVIPGYERLHVYSRELQSLELVNSTSVSAVRTDAYQGSSISIQTSEGYRVDVDVSVLYRVVDPYSVLTQVGPGRLYVTSVVVPRSDKILRQTLGQLNAEEFYSDRLRVMKAEEARALLEEEFSPLGIQVWSVLIREYRYDERYQQAIEDRKIQDQTVFKNQAEAIAASRDAERERVVAEGKATIQVELERGRAEVRRIKAEADRYYRERVAEGNKLVELARAEGDRLENEALQVAGASNIVGLEMAEALTGAEVIVVSTTGAGGVNPLDLDSLIQGW